jgi:hypothetical protein
MAINISGQKLYATPNNSNVLANQNKASVALKFRFDPNGVSADSSISFLISRNFYSSAWIALIGAGTTSNTVRCQFAWRTAATQVTRNIDLAVGVTQHLAMTYDQGLQLAWVNGVARQLGTLTGPTQAGASPFRIGGWDTVPRSGSIFTVDDVAVWNDYVLTAMDIANLRDGLRVPSQIGGTASWRGEWTLAGASNQTPTIGQPGLANGYGDANYDLTSITGAGTATYVDPLVWVPSARIKEARIGTGGGTLFVFFKSIVDDSDATPQVLNADPSLRVNGSWLGPLANPWCSGKHGCVMYTLPSGQSVQPGDVVTLDAPTIWADTSAGLVEASSGQAVVNRVGQSCLRAPSFAKTLRTGINFEYFATAHNALNWIPKNLAKVLSAGSGVATRDASGKPLTLTGTSAEFSLYQSSALYLENQIDDTGYPGPTGLFAVGWDSLSQVSPTTWTLATLDANTTTVTERVDLRNPGVNGVGQVRVYDVQRKAGSVVAHTDIKAIVTNAAKAPQYANLMIFAPGDFSYQNGVPTTLTMPAPYAVSASIVDRFRNPGSIRMWHLLLSSVTCPFSEPEHIRDAADFTWGWRGSKVNSTFGYTSVGPYSRADTPYFYSQVMGSKYAATLATAIDAGATTLIISDAATAPVLVGQRLFLDSEVVRVDDVNGTTVTVTRGMEDTTPAAHQAGAIQVGYRNAMVELGTAPFNSAVHMKFTTATPHRLLTGTLVDFSGSPWPVLFATDGRATPGYAGVYPPAYAGSAIVTGARSFVVRLGPYESPAVTLTGTASLDYTTHITSVKIGDNPQLPYPMASSLANTLDSPNLLIAIPHMATKDLVLKIARQVRDSIDSGRTVWLEISNETWNTGAGYVNQHLFFSYLSASLYPGDTLLAAYVRRTKDVVDLFRQVFDEGGRNRSGQVKCFLNVQFDTLNGVSLLSWAAAQSPPIKVDGFAASPYINVTNTNQFDTATAALFGNLTPDQAIDLWVHALAYRADAGGVPHQAGLLRSAVATYNAALSHDCKFFSYEGGLELPFSATMVNAQQRTRDFYYHPSMYVAEQDFYAIAQQAGFEMFNVFCSAADWNGSTTGYAWGLYHGVQQPHGRGDGSDGQADNRLCLATPGYPNSKAATVNQDSRNVSVRGQAWLDWNSVATPTPAGGVRLHRGRKRSHYSRV